jgi:hypothetical protein
VRSRPAHEEVEELLHPLGRWRGTRGGPVVADVAGGIELVEGVDEPGTEGHLDLGRLAGHEERVEALERVDVAPARRRRHGLGSQLADDSVDVLSRHLPGRPAAQGQHPFEHAVPVLDGDGAEAASDLRRHETVDACSLERLRILDSQSRCGRSGPGMTRRPPLPTRTPSFPS